MFKVICNQKDLSKAIGECQKAINNKSTLEILKNFYIKASNNSVEIIGYDLSIGITSSFNATVSEEGSFVINAKQFSDLIRKLPQKDIELIIENNKLNLKCGHCNYSFDCESASEYPSLPKENDYTYITFDSEMFKRMIKETVFATSKDATKPVLNGCSIEITPEKLTIAAIDGYRLAISDYKLETQDIESKFIVPAKTLLDISSLLNSDIENFKLGFNEKHIIVSTDTTKLIGRLIEGNFIDYNNFLPKEFSSFFAIDKDEISSSVDRVSISLDTKDQLCVFDIKKDNINISSKANKRDGSEDLPISLCGEDMIIGFNSKYLLEGLKVFNTENILMYFNNGVSPAIIKPVYEESSKYDYTYLILPVRFNR